VFGCHSPQLASEVAALRAAVTSSEAEVKNAFDRPMSLCGGTQRYQFSASDSLCSVDPDFYS